MTEDQTVRLVLAWIGLLRRFGQAWQRVFAWRGRPTWIFGPEPRQPSLPSPPINYLLTEIKELERRAAAERQRADAAEAELERLRAGIRGPA